MTVSEKPHKSEKPPKMSLQSASRADAEEPFIFAAKDGRVCIQDESGTHQIGISFRGTDVETNKKTAYVEMDLFMDFYDNTVYGIPTDRKRRSWFDCEGVLPLKLVTGLEVTQIRLMVVPPPIFADEA